MEVLELEAIEVSNELATLVLASGVEKTKSQKLLEMFTPYFNKMGEIEGKIKVLNTGNPGKEDVKIAREIRLALKNNRVAAEKIKDDSKAAILIEGRLIDNLNNIVKNTSKALEMQCENIEKDAEIKEAARLAELKSVRVELLSPFVEDANIYPLGTISEDSFNDLLMGSKLAYEAKMKAVKEEEEKRILEEKEKLQEQLRLKAENENLKSENQKKELQIKKDREEFERIAKIEADKNAGKLAKIEADNKAHRERAAKDQAEQLSKLKTAQDAAVKSASELKIRKDAEAKELANKVAAEKRAAKAPDKAKIKSFIDGMSCPATPSLNTNEAADVLISIQNKFVSFKIWAIQQSELL